MYTVKGKQLIVKTTGQYRYDYYIIIEKQLLVERQDSTSLSLDTVSRNILNLVVFQKALVT